MFFSEILNIVKQIELTIWQTCYSYGMLKFGKIGRRLLGWFVFVALIPLVFMGVQGYNSARQAIEQEAYLHMQAVAATKVAQIEMWFEERRRDVWSLTSNPQLAASAEVLSRSHSDHAISQITATLEAYRHRSKAYDYFCLYNAAGMALCCTQTGAELVADFDQSSLFRRASESDEPVLSDIYLHERIGPVIQIAGRFLGADGQTLGLLVATLSLSQTLNPIILDSTGLGRTGEAYVVDSERWMLTPSRFMNHPAPLTHQMDSDGIRRALEGTSGAAVYEGWYGEPVLGAYYFIQDRKWALLAEISADEAFAPLATFRQSMIIAALLTLAAILIIVMFVSRSISNPIRNLAEASKQISEGNLQQTVTTHLRDELGDLAERFNFMVKSLRESRESERESYETLVLTREDLLRAEKLAAVGEIAASIVHEVRNPLSSVKMNLQILESRLSSDATLVEHTRLALTQTIRLERLLNELLDFSRPIALDRSKLSLAETVTEAVNTFRTSVDLGSREMTVSIHTDNTVANADRDKVHQILLNLLLNAAQATGEKRTIEIAIDRVFVESRRMIKISVRDNGRGIPDSKLEKVFEPFFTTRKDGTGLGLPIAKKIVEAHGGKMQINSTVDVGTTIEFTLPEAS